MYLKNLPLLISVVGLISACGNPSQDDLSVDDSNNDTTTNRVVEHRIEHAQKVFYMLPSPIESAAMLHKAGAAYDGNLLNPVENAAQYESTASRAINLGIYGSDLSYASIFDQTNESMLYVTAAKKLADELGVTQAFTQETLNRVEENINNKDSMLNIISECYWIADSHLKEDERHSISAMIFTGGWVEGLYIACKTVELSPNDVIRQRIAEQKYSLENLVTLVESYGQDQDIKPVIEELMDLQSSFDKIEIVKEGGENSVQDGVTVIGGERKLNFSDDLLKEIQDKIYTIRNKHIKS